MADLHEVRLLVFRVADLACAVDVSVVREIGPAPKATRIPGAMHAVDGLINLRGELVPLIDGPRLLGRPAAPTEPAMVLLTHEGRTLGLVVDEVLDLFAVPEQDLADRDALPGVDPRLVRAVGRRGGLTFVVLDLEALLGPVLVT
jgi:purine-binding chemotaxis protein CheW